ncbi:MAG TPA: class A beta-lactamase [Allosphingosinicella sp.]|jgi:beta-lactamase class A|nr:class A beta-lactamase [Allosphingosinicella sp.]
MIDRRTFLAAGAAALAAGCRAAPPKDDQAREAQPDRIAAESSKRLVAIRSTLGPGGRLGMAAIDTGSGRELRFDADSLYSMASTFKLPLAAAVLARVDSGEMSLEEKLPIPPGKPVANSPAIERYRGEGSLSIVRLCSAIVELSDNAAANMLLRRIGGPEALNRFIRSCGDTVTRLDRFETELNSNSPGDRRDTTSPAAMARLARALVLGDKLSEPSRRHLSTWLTKSVPGHDRLKAGLPSPPWLVGHKTGTGANGALNDVAVAWHSGKPPVVVACYQSGGTADHRVRAAAHAAVGRLVAEIFA